MHYFYLLIAIVFETIGTTALQASQQFTKLWPSLIVIGAYGIAFWLLSLTLRLMPVGIVYAIWSGFGIVMIALIGFLVFKQKLDFAAVIGISMIIAGILVIHLFSKSATH